MDRGGGGLQSALATDEAERRFLEDLEKAKALSLEQVALDKYRRERLLGLVPHRYDDEVATPPLSVPARSSFSGPISDGPSSVAKTVRPRTSSSFSSTVNQGISIHDVVERRNSCQVADLPAKPRPRPVRASVATGLVRPPPLPKRQPRTPSVTVAGDLINLRSPLSKHNPHDALLRELDAACSSWTPLSLPTPTPVPTPMPPPPPSVAAAAAAEPAAAAAAAAPRLVASPLSDLIDLGFATMAPSDSVLMAFDPLLNADAVAEDGDVDVDKVVSKETSPLKRAERKEDADPSDPDAADAAETTAPENYDPFDFFDLNWSTRNKRETIYEVLSKEHSPVKQPQPLRPPAAAPAAAATTTSATATPAAAVAAAPAAAKKDADRPLRIDVEWVDAARADAGLAAFAEEVRRLRQRYQSHCEDFNLGYVISARVEADARATPTSIKMAVLMLGAEPAINFTCEVSSSVEDVVERVLRRVDAAQAGAADFILKVWARAEYLAAGTRLADYEYVHECVKLERDVRFCLLRRDDVERPLRRTARDDTVDADVGAEDVASRQPVDALTHDALRVLLDTLHGEIDRLVASNAANPVALLQAVKALCSMLGRIETTELTVALANLASLSTESAGRKPEIVAEEGPYSWVVLPSSASAATTNVPVNRVRSVCADVVAALRKLIGAYTSAYRVNFALTPAATASDADKTGWCLSTSLLDCVTVRLGALHRLEHGWTFDEYEIRAELRHGVVSMASSRSAVAAGRGRAALACANRVALDRLVCFDSVALCTLPRESRLVLTVYGRRRPPDQDPAAAAAEVVELGWTAQDFFQLTGDHWTLVQGTQLLALWPVGSDKRSGHVPKAGRHRHGHQAALLSVELPERDARFPAVDAAASASASQPRRELASLDDRTQQTLLDAVRGGSFAVMDLYRRELLWEKRHYLTEESGALARILLAAQSWDWASLADLYWLLEHWTPLSPLEALQLLLPWLPDVHVRRRAVDWLRPIGVDELLDYLPQLIEALKLETHDHSPLMLFLLERSLQAPQVAHALYWLLNQQLPGASPQNSDFDDVAHSVDPRYSGRLQLLLRSLLATCGDALRRRFFGEQVLVQELDACAELVKTTKESARLAALHARLEPIHDSLQRCPASIPISASLQVQGLEVRSCAYFPSNTLPLKLAFQSAEAEVLGQPLISAIYKVGDDLRQDALTLQMVRIMDKLWLKHGLDLKMVTFACVPTGPRRGFVELVTDAETLRRIQVEHGLTGSFKDRPIADWLAKLNPTPLEYERAVHNFTASCAGYSVATYVFGVCDRHNDNIMVKSTGHLFHIDFGKFLGDAQMFGNFKRDRSPFVLTSDMAYVINGGDRPSQQFHHFVDLCCQAFNIVRQHSNELLHLLALMASSGIPGVNADAVAYVQRALLPDKSNSEAAAHFARMIEDSLRSWFTQFNFFLHNLSQLRFHGDHNDDRLLSFVPKTYSMATDGRITEARVVAFQKRYDPEKFYVYIVSVQRQLETESTYLYRTHREFCELYQKLCIKFPLIANRLQGPSKGGHLGRSSVQVVAEKRRSELDALLSALLGLAEEVAHSDLVYTFLHPLLRDQDEAADVQVAKLRTTKSNADSASGRCHAVRGQLKISVQYTRGELHVMIQHGRNLQVDDNEELPSPYVKTYLLPDAHKVTKRKTRVVRRNANPSFMEMLVYRLPLDGVRNRHLQVSVWSYDRVQENAFLGQVTLALQSLDLTVENVDWHPLGD